MKISFVKIQPAVFAVIVVAAVFIFTIFLSVKNGKALADGKTVINEAGELVKGLVYFYSDQNRFPTLEEFSNKDIQLTYFTQTVDNVSKTEICKQNFVYKRLKFNSYELNFCLAVDSDGYVRGWNKITKQSQQ